MGAMVTDGRRGLRALAAVVFGVTLVLLLAFPLLLPDHAGATAQPVVQVPNGAGRLDTLALYDRGKRSAELATLVAENGAFAPAVGWRSGKGRFNAAKAKFVVGDVNGDSLADGIALVDLGKKTACLYVFLANGPTFTKQTAWKSAKGAFAWSRAKLAVGDVDDDGLDDVLVLYDRGRATASVERFALAGKKFVKTTLWRSARGGLAWSASQIAAGDATGDRKADAIVLTRESAAESRLTVIAESGGAFAASEFWRGASSAKTRLLAGDVDSDGACDAVLFQDRGDGTTTLDVLLSSKSAFADPVTWWTSASGALSWSKCRVAAGDVTGDGKADVVVQSPSAASSSKLAACVSTGTAFTAEQWWSGSPAAARTQLGSAPSAPFVLADDTEVLGEAALAALESVTPDQATFRFAIGSAQAEALAAGDIIVAEPGPLLPYGALRKVTAVSRAGGEIVVTTTQAALDEAVTDGELVVNGTVTQDDIVKVLSQAPGVRLVSDRDGFKKHGLSKKRDRGAGLELEFDLTLLETVALEGTIGFEQSFSLSATNNLGFLKKIRFTSTTEQTTSLRAAVQQTLEIKHEQEIGSYMFPTFVVVFGVVPVSFTPELSVYVGAQGDVTVGVSARVTQTTTATAGIEWKVGANVPTPVRYFDTDRTYDPPRLFGTMSLKAFAGIQLMLKIYFVAGPSLAVEPYLGLFANTEETPWWKLAYGIDVEAGGKVEALGTTVAELTLPFNLFERILLQASGEYQETKVSGKITSAATGQALADATVELREGAGDPAGAVWGSATTGADGKYSFTGPPGGAYTLVANKTSYQQGTRSVEVLAGSAVTGQDIALTRGTAPGGNVSGLVLNAATSAPIGGATVEVRQGADAPFGPLLETVKSAADGRYEVLDLPVGKCTVVASKAGFDPNSRTADISSNGTTAGHDILLTQTGQHASMRSALDGHIRWTRQFDTFPNATYELWFRPIEPGGMEYGNDIAQISRDYPDWMGGGPTRWPIMSIQFAGSPSTPTVSYWINEYVGDEQGVIHRLTGTTQLQMGQWYHIAVQYGSLGMKLYVNGRLEASNTYKKRAEANEGASAGGWFSLGDNDTLGSGYMSAVGDFRGLRVSTVERYPTDFLPQAVPRDDGLTTIHDALAGTTNGDNVNFVPTPVTP